MPRFEVTSAMEAQATAALDALAELAKTQGTVRIAQRASDEWVLTCAMNTFIRRTLRGVILESWARLCHDVKVEQRARVSPRSTSSLPAKRED